METNYSLSFPLYNFTCDENLLKSVESTFDQQKWMKDENNSNTDQYYHHDLFIWINDCIDQVKKIYYNDRLSLTISSCWLNKNVKLQRSPLHNHVNSILSGVLYFSDEKTSPLVFYIPNPYLKLQLDAFLHLSDTDNRFIKHQIVPKRGMLIIFPSSIMHETLAHKENHIRYSLAFNTFVSGDLIDNPTGKLNIKTFSNNL